MKDNQDLLRTLSFFKGLSEETRNEFSLLKKAQTITITTLAELLSNNGSEWIDSMLAGKLSFSDFSILDTQEFQEYTRELFNRNMELSKLITTLLRAGDRAEDGAGLDAAVVMWWRERAEGLNWTLKATEGGYNWYRKETEG